MSKSSVREAAVTADRQTTYGALQHHLSRVKLAEEEDPTRNYTCEDFEGGCLNSPTFLVTMIMIYTVKSRPQRA